VPILALITWIVTAIGGLFLLAIWLIEYDPDFQRASATRLPVPVVALHALLALGGLVLWVMYLISDDDRLAWATLTDLGLIVALGLTMAARWLGTYRDRPFPAAVAVAGGRLPASASAFSPWDREAGEPSGASPRIAIPPERHFPVSVVIGHGVFAFTTVTLVLLTTIGLAGS